MAKESEQDQFLFETLPLGIVYQSADGKITAANPAAERILGLSLDQMQGRTSVDPRWKATREDGTAFPGETHPAMVALKTGQSVYNVIMGVYSPQDNTQKWININAVPQFRAGEVKPYQVYTTFDDVTERKRVEVELRESERKYRQLLETLQEGVWAIDQEAKTTFVNPRMAIMLGYTVEEMFGQPLFSFMDERGVELAKYNMARRQQGISEQHDFEFLRKDGSRLYASLETSPLTDAQGNYVGALAGVIDVTKRKQAESELEKHRVHLEELVVERTTEMKKKVEELERFRQATIDREFRVKELQDELDQLKKKTDQR